MSNEEHKESQEKKLLLWVFCASNGKAAELTHTYARSEDQARVQLQHWMAQQVTLGRDHIDVKHYPGGFQAGYRFRWSGSIPASQLAMIDESARNNATAE